MGIKMENIKILVVDDESRMRKLVRDFLVREDYEVLEESLRKKLRISEKNRASEKKALKKTDGYRKKYEITLFISVILAVSVIGMFIVASTSDSPTIINYENKLIDKYAAWEQELDEREAALKEREQTVEEP